MAVSYILPIFHADNDNGTPLAGGLLYTYESGSNTPAVTYQDQAGTINNSNPIVLDGRGEAVIFLQESLLYTFDLRTPLDAGIWTQDDIGGAIGASGSTVWCGDAGGTADAILLSPATPVTSYVAGAAYRFLATANNSGNMTIAVSALSPISLKNNGEEIPPGTVLAGNEYLVVFDGAGFQLENAALYTPTPDVSDDEKRIVNIQYINEKVIFPAIRGAASNLKLRTTGTSSIFSITFDQIALQSDAGQYKIVSDGSLTVNSATSGANGLDAGSLATSTWYAVHIIYNPDDDDVAGLISLSATAPTLPSGYIYSARMGWVRTDATVNKYPFGIIQAGREVQYIVAAGSNVPNLPIMASGIAGSTTVPTWAAISTANYVPPTSTSIKASASQQAGGTAQIMMAPNNSYGPYSSLTNPPPFSFSQSGAAATIGSYLRLNLESANIYWACSASGAVSCIGWEDGD